MQKSPSLALALVALVLRLSDIQPATGGSFRTTGSMNAPRNLHTATLLPKGKVLVAGGQGRSGLTNSAELYDPATGTWTATGALNEARYVNTVTLLPDGKVLVAGGFGWSGFLNSAELYDPATGKWTTTGSLTTVRGNTVATLLLNGKVLIAGGRYENFSIDPRGLDLHLASAELYDPPTGKWTATGALTTRREGHTATLLPNGKVLVAGGKHYDDNWISLASAELYDPATGMWSATGPLNTARAVHTATLLPNGKVLVAGGYDSDFKNLSSAESYDPATGTWTRTGELNNPHVSYGYTPTLLHNGKVLIAGGYGLDRRRKDAELYDPAIGTWTVTGEMSTPRLAHTATLLLNGTVLVAGGSEFDGVILGNSGVLSSTELYDPGDGIALILSDFGKLWSGAFQFGFSSSTETAFSVLGTTNLALPVSKWTVLGVATEVSRGQFKFIDSETTNSPQRFYRVRSP